MLRIDNGRHGEHCAVSVVDDWIDRRVFYEVEVAGKMFLPLVGALV